MSRRSEGYPGGQADKMIREPWDEIPYFFAEHWGSFATAVCINPTLTPEIQHVLTRRIELDGSNFLYHRPNVEVFEDLTGWLSDYLPSVWGPKADIARIALMLHIDPSHSFQTEHAQRSVLAQRFPCPILFHLETHTPWNDWILQHKGLLGRQVELYPAQEGLEELAVP